MKMIVVYKNGTIVESNKYFWNEETKTFSSNENELIFDFGDLQCVTIKCGNYCNIICGHICDINSGYNCNIFSGDYCNINSWNDCVIKFGINCSIKTYWNTTIIPKKNCTLSYIFSGICVCYKLEENKLVKILQSGKLQ